MEHEDIIVEITEIECDSLRFDIEVEDNHNFFANGILVHNCQNMAREIFSTQDTWITLGSSVTDAAERVGMPEQEVLGLLAAGKWVQNEHGIQKLQKAAAIPNRKFEITMKLDGSSATMGRYEDSDFVCSRNFELKQEGEAAENNRFVRMFKGSGLKSALAVVGNYAVQGELMGPGIQGNPEGFHEDRLFIFDVYDTNTAQKLPPADRRAILEKLYEAGVNREQVQHVPVLYESVSLEELGITDIQGLVAFADGKSLNAKNREGLVFKDALTGSFSFKAISRVWLLNEK